MPEDRAKLRDLLNKIGKEEFPFINDAIGKIDTGSVGPKEISTYELLNAVFLLEAIEKEATIAEKNLEAAELRARTAKNEAETAAAQGERAAKLTCAMNWLTGALVLIGIADILVTMLCK